MIPPVAAAVALPAALIEEAPVAAEPSLAIGGPFLGDVIFRDNHRAYIWMGDRWCSEKDFIDRGGFSS
jgi:hypothetical protein